MTAPMWMASPPEVHAALLGSGPGPAPLLAAAATWRAISVEYGSAADELADILADTRTGAWHGPSGESFVAAHAPYLTWLTQTSVDSAEAAAQHEMAATAYTGAMAAMPTLPELAGNRAVHGVLLATNFFGVNTIPIAVNEADYVRMWVQAATAMTTYQAAASAAVATTPQTGEPPEIVSAEATGHGDDDDHHDHEHGFDSPLNQFVADMLRLAGIDWDPVEGTLNGLPFEAYASPSDPLWWTARALELFSDFQQFGTMLLDNPTAAFEFVSELVLFDYPTHLAQLTSWLPTQPQLFLAPLLFAVAPLGALTGLAGLAGAPPPAPVEVRPPTPSAAASIATAPGTSTAPASGSTATSAPAHAQATNAAGESAPLASQAASGVPPVPPFAVAPPGVGFGSSSSASVTAGSKDKSPVHDSALASVAATTPETARTRRRQRAREHGGGEEFMTMNIDVAPHWDLSATGASEFSGGRIGFTGVASTATRAAAGLSTVAGNDFSDGPVVPMIPSSWKAGESEPPALTPQSPAPRARR